ncbi:MAG: methyltransferase domain-containing protein [Terriglobales bacterium]
MKQVDIPELLDTDSGTPEEVANALADMEGINRRFGGVSTMQAMVERVSEKLGRNSFTLLEVAAGAGYVPQAARRRLEARGIHLQLTLLDRAQSHLPRETAQDSAAGNGRSAAIVGDALALPFPDSSFDLVDCSLFAHHLLPDELIRFVGEGLRVCRVAVLINDIVRHPAHLALVYAATPLFRSRLTRHDAPASVRRAYTPGEFATLLAKTGAKQIEIQRRYLFRVGVIAWKKIAWKNNGNHV